ncbi:head-tail connector protein [Erythrobacter sp. HA6-11]
MQRAIVLPADLSGAALEELKQWLGVSRDAEDAKLISLLQASLEMCEAFTGQIPLEVELEERLAPSGEWQRLSSRPIRAITSAEWIARDGVHTLLTTDDYEIDIDAQSVGSIRVKRQINGTAIRVQCCAGVAPRWADLPDALRHGIVRLAAYHYRERDMDKPLTPPASVAALWRPWRLMRFA